MSTINHGELGVDVHQQVPPGPQRGPHMASTGHLLPEGDLQVVARSAGRLPRQATGDLTSWNPGGYGSWLYG